MTGCSISVSAVDDSAFARLGQRGACRAPADPDESGTEPGIQEHLLLAGIAGIERPLTGILKSYDRFGAARSDGWPAQVA